MTSIGKEFMRQSAMPLSDETPQGKGLPQPPLTLEPDAALPLTDLPDPASFAAPPIDLRDAIERRRTLRAYAERSLTLAELSYLLWVTQGIRQVTDRPATLRTVPSAGARHAFETLVLANRVEGLPPGLYRYAARSHQLATVSQDTGFAARLAAACLDQPHVENCAAAFFWVAVPARMAWRYGERGYRYLHLDAGHVCQNLYLAAEQLGCGVCAIGAFDDAALNGALDLDGEEQFIIYGATLGHRA